MRCHYCKSEDLIINPRPGDALKRVQVSCMACGGSGPITDKGGEAFRKYMEVYPQEDESKQEPPMSRGTFEYETVVTK